MVRYRLRPTPRVRPSALAILLILSLPFVVAAAPDRVLHRGEFDAGSLTWERTEAGSVPRLGQAPIYQQDGVPQVPSVSVTVLVPADAALGDVTVVPLRTRLLDAPAPLAPGRPLISSEGVAATQDLVRADAGRFPAAWGLAGGDSYRRGYRLLSVTVFPVRAVRGTDGTWAGVEVLEEYEIRTSGTVPAPAPAERAVRRLAAPGERERLERELARVVANPGALYGYAREDGVPAAALPGEKTMNLGESPVSYLIITSEALASTFQTLADHRTAGGLPAVVKTVEWIEANYRHGADLQETIRGFIREAYERWGVEYVLLGGDTDIIPARYALSNFYPPTKTTDIPADLYYACLDGNWNADGDQYFGEAGSTSVPADDADMAAEVFLGRAPVSTVGEAQNFVAKVVGYETSPASGAYPNKILLAAEVLFRSESGDITLDGAVFAEEIFHELVEPNSAMGVVRMYESFDETDGMGAPLYPGSVRETKAAVVDSLNTSSFGIFVQIGHGFFFNMSMGDTDMTVSDADALANVDHPFLLYGLNCASCAFDYSCLMERFVQNDQGGAIASIGASRAAFPYTSNDFQYEFFRLYYEDGVTRLGDLIDSSKLPWLSLAYSNSFTRWTFLNYTLLGDPGMALWRDLPAAADVALPGSVGGGDQTLNVTVSSGGSPVENAVVTVRGGGAYATGTTDAGGAAALPLVVNEAGPLTVDVHGQDLVWTQDTVAVDFGGAFVGLADMAVVDDGTFGTSGNGNGRAEAGETVGLWPTFAGVGSGGSGAATATLASAETGVTVVDGSVGVPAIAAGAQAQSDAPFVVALDAGVADGLRLDFDLAVNDGAKALYENAWTLLATAPEVETVALDWYDTFFGDGDGIVDDGERISVRLTLKNFGAGTADLVTGRLRSNTPNAVIQDSVVTFGPMDLLDSSQGSGLFSFALTSAAAAYDARIDFTDNHGRTFSHPFELSAPSAPQGLAATGALGPDIIGLSWTPDTNPALRGYHVYRSENEGGPFARVSDDIVENIAYFRDTGLGLLTRYYYRVTSVDTSLVESPASGTIAQSTAPPEITNFPLPFEAESSGHFAVGDVTGDGRLEIVFGADEIYVWRADGSELFDGDGDSQTLGPITNAEGTFGPLGIALAELDGQPGLEIVCQDRNAMLVHVLDAKTGQDIPGWPQPMLLNWAWATPAVGDVDGDGDLEIVINNQAGLTFVWHHDGTELRDGDSDPGTNGVFLVRPEGRWAYARCSPALFDLDGDGAAEIIFGTKYAWNAENKLHAFKYDGTEAAGFPYVVGLGANITSSPTIADLNGDGTWEIIFLHELDELVVVQQDGTDYPGFPIAFTSNNGSVSCPSPAVGDFDGDGQLEIAAVSTVSVISAFVSVIDTDPLGGSGSVLPGWPQEIPGNSESSPVVGDINGDGFPDIVHGIGGGDEETLNEIFAFDHQGAPVEGFPITLGGPIRPALVITDLDDDHDVDIVYGGWDGYMHVWDMPFAADGTQIPWGTFRGHYHRDGVYRNYSPTGVEDAPRYADLTLQSIRPNPFNPSTTVRLYVPGAGRGELEVDVFDVQGRRVRRLHEGPLTEGWHDFVWNGRDDAGRPQASGLYLLRAKGDAGSVSAKMALVR